MSQDAKIILEMCVKGVPVCAGCTVMEGLVDITSIARSSELRLLGGKYEGILRNLISANMFPLKQQIRCAGGFWSHFKD